MLRGAGCRTVQTRTLTSTTVITYAYECAASLKRSKRDAANRLVNVDGVDYTWDANPFRYAARTSPSRSARGLRGNLLSDGVRTFTYECAASLKQSERGAANRLMSVTGGALTTTFEYDGLPAPVAQAQVGNRVAQTVDGVTTEYVLDVAGGLPEVIVATTGRARALEPLSPLSGAECAERRSGQRHQRISATSAVLWQEPGLGPMWRRVR